MTKKSLKDISIFRAGNSIEYKGEWLELKPDFILTTQKPIRLNQDLIDSHGFKNGFIRLEGNIYQVNLTNGRTRTFQISKNGKYSTIVKYVHELQNAFFALSHHDLSEDFDADEKTRQQWREWYEMTYCRNG